MALTFPSNPTLNQVYSTGSLSWTWNGKSWNNGTSILATSNLVSSSVQFTNGNTTAFDTTSNITVGQITASFAKISGSIFGTASFATNAFSASYAPNIYVLPSNVVSSSAQHANGGGVAFDTNTNITVGQITASFAKITNLTVEYVTSSVMVITGSNKFGDASNDKQEFTGSVSMSGSLSVVGNVTSNNVLSLASGTVALPSLILSTDTTSGMYRIGANNIGISISAAKVLDISSTGLSVTGTLSASGGYNGTVGATTRNTVAATTISTTGTVTATADNIKAFVGTTGAGTGFAYGTYETNGGAQYGRVGIEGSVGGNLMIGTSAYDFIVGGISGNTWIGAGGTGIAKVSGTGLAVTGAVSTTKDNGGITLNNSTSGNAEIYFQAGGTNKVRIGLIGGSTPNGLRIYSDMGGAEYAIFSSTGLAVTGALTTSGNITSNFSDPYLTLNRAGTTNYSGILFKTAGATTGGWEIYGTNVASQILNIYSYAASSVIGAFSSTGLAVTGTLSSTGTLSTTSAASFSGTGLPYLANSLMIRNSGTGDSQLWALGPNTSTNGTMTFVVADSDGSATSTFAVGSNTGLAVTGALSATGIISQTPNAGDPSYKTELVTAYNGADSFRLKVAGATFLRVNTNDGVLLAPSGLAVTGALSATGAITYGAATDGAFSAIFAGNALNGIQLRDSTDTSGAVFAAFRNGSATTIGSISRVTTTNAVAYNTTSDGRLKENLRDFTDSGRLIDSLKPRVFDWKNSDENGKNVVGFVAQEEHAADPIFAHIGAVSVGDEDSETITKQWQRSDSALIPILVAELKALRQRVAALESK